MSAKRTAPYGIDQKTLQAKDNNQDNQQSPTPNEQSASDRVIYKVKQNEAAPETKDNNNKKEEVKPEEKKDEKKKSLLFGDIFNNSNGVGLFGNVGLFNNTKPLVASTEPPKINFSSGNLFTGNGFSNLGKTSIFSNSSSGSIFGFGTGSNAPPVKNNNGEEDDEADSAQLQKDQNMEIDKTKSKGNYKYQEQAKVLASGIAKKYKKNNGDLVENVEIILQQDAKAHLVFIVARLVATKHNIFSGIVLRKKSEVRVLNSKNQNLEVTAFVVNKGKPAEKIKLKLQFETADIGKTFYNAIEEAIKAEVHEEKVENTEKEKEETKEKPAQQEVKSTEKAE